MHGTRYILLMLTVLTVLHRDANAVPPGILHIVVDDLGWNDVGFHGSEIPTPVIDELAAESVVLNRFYVSPICSPTRAGLLTGRYPFRYGIWNSVVSPSRRHGLPPEETTTPELLADLGYQDRVLLGKWHLGLASTRFHPLRHGFTQFYGHYNGALDYFTQQRMGQRDWHRDYEASSDTGYTTDLIADEAVRFIQQRSSGQPFYLVVCFNAPHSPLQATDDALASAGFNPQRPLAANTDQRLADREGTPTYGLRGRGNTTRQTFSAMVRSLDQAIGRILTALQQQHLAEDTLLVFHSDNGGVPEHGGSNQPLRGNKFTCWEGGVRVVAMVRWPRQLRPGTCEALTGYVDLLPTFISVAGGDAPAELDGRSFLPFTQREQHDPDRVFILGQDTAVGQRWKLHEGEYYDLQTDPTETHPAKREEIPEDVAAALQEAVRNYALFAGPASNTALPMPPIWPPPAWKLPTEDHE